jgi:hypothetical protein
MQQQERRRIKRTMLNVRSWHHSKEESAISIVQCVLFQGHCDRAQWSFRTQFNEFYRLDMQIGLALQRQFCFV